MARKSRRRLAENENGTIRLVSLLRGALHGAAHPYPFCLATWHQRLGLES